MKVPIDAHGVAAVRQHNLAIEIHADPALLDIHNGRPLAHCLLVFLSPTVPLLARDTLCLRPSSRILSCSCMREGHITSVNIVHQYQKSELQTSNTSELVNNPPFSQFNSVKDNAMRFYLRIP